MVTRWIERVDYDGAGGAVAITFHIGSGQGLDEDRAEAAKETAS